MMEVIGDNRGSEPRLSSWLRVVPMAAITMKPPPSRPNPIAATVRAEMAPDGIAGIDCAVEIVIKVHAARVE